MDDTWIKLQRKFIDWEWFDTDNMVRLFIYILVKANHKDGQWKGIPVKRGQLITGLNSLSDKTNISIQTLRTCLTRLEKTGEINSKVTNKYRVITICNYDSYQGSQQETNKLPNKQLTGNQQSTNKQSTANKNVKKEKNVNNVKNEYNKNKNKTNDKPFIGFIEWLLSEDFVRIYKLPDHLDEEKFNKIYEKANYNGDLIKTKIIAMENRADLLKNTSFYLTLRTWLSK